MLPSQIKIFFFILIIYSLTFSQPKLSYNLILEVNKELPKYGFLIERTHGDAHFNNYIINIYQAESNKFIQSINMDNYDVYYSQYDYPYIDSLIDVNFDNYKDLCIAAGSGQNGKNQLFHIFLFDKSTGEFYKNSSFDTIYNLYVDDSLKHVYESFWTGACAVDCIMYNTYKVIDDNLTLIESDYSEYDSETETMRRYIEIYENSKLISKKEVLLEENVK